ncbi:MAG: 50S ribosomal protein L21e [Candidatus Woesearchaeota archaeon]
MTKRIGGGRRKTRYKFQKKSKDKGKLSLTRYFQKFDADEKVKLLSEPAIQKGMYDRRFHGKIGTIIKNRGSCYILKIKDGSKEKELIVHPIHLRKIKK